MSENELDFPKIADAIRAANNSLNNLYIESHCQRQLEEINRIERQNAPIIKKLQKLVEQVQQQNEVLSEQVKLLKEENELQKKQVEDAKIAEAFAKKEAMHSKVFGWVSFGVATIISIIALFV